MEIDLVWIADRAATPSSWALGATHVAGPSPADVGRVLSLAAEQSEAVVCWAASLGTPSRQVVESLLTQPDDVFHAGLSLGRSGLPRIVEAIDPAWMLGLDAPTDIESTSWRLALEACVIRSSVVARLGSVDPGFRSLSGAALELGHRWIDGGARLRATPALVSRRSAPPSLPASDEARLARLRYGRPWALWGAATSPSPLARRVAVAASVLRGPDPVPVRPSGAARPTAVPSEAMAEIPAGETVSIVIPTIDRVPYLREVLTQLRAQTVRPHQILVIDQTPEVRRDHDLAADFADLPLVVTRLEEPGQCTARNMALGQATGTTLLFLDDDDDEIPPELIEGHLRVMATKRVDAVCGVAEEDGAGPLPEAFTRPRVSDVFPTNNTLLRRSALEASGAFDPAYDRGDRADHDLGTRLYLTGARLWLEPSLRVRHRHAPRGGLRTHNARTTTFAKRRATILHRQQLSPTQIYLWRRYCTPTRVRRAEAISVLSQLRRPGPISGGLARLATQLVLLPDTIAKARRSRRAADELLRTSPGPVPVAELTGLAP